MIKPIKFALLTALLTIAVGGANAQLATRLQTPQQDADYAKGVSGHIAASLAEDYVMLVGGCNFPDAPAAEGGAKRFYSHVYATRGLLTGQAWERLGNLPEPLAYASGRTYLGRLIIAGGETTGGRDLASVYALSVNETGQLAIDTLPSLPEPRSAMASALIRSRLYLIGGRVSGRLSNSVISLDLDEPQLGWRQERSYPSAALLKVLATEYWLDEEPYIFLMGAFAGSEGEEGVRTALSCYTLRADDREASWQRVPVPYASLRRGATFGGGIMTLYGEDEIMVASGVHEAKFLPALQRIQRLRRARRLGQTDVVSRLEAEGRAYLLHAPQWYSFTPFMLVYNLRTQRWRREHAHPDLARADAAYLDGIIIGGEIKPGVRTSSIALVQH
ncbi:MAG: hypothetical protein Q4A64_03005 [Porphyromonadaceae bacterium]|nr:hypothetical protein [Porphyromonadaceae bacterium]